MGDTDESSLEEPSTEEESEGDGGSSDSEIGFSKSREPTPGPTDAEVAEQMEIEIKKELEEKLKTSWWLNKPNCFLCQKKNRRKRVSDLRGLAQHAENWGETRKIRMQHMCLGRLVRKELEKCVSSVGKPDGTAHGIAGPPAQSKEEESTANQRDAAEDDAIEARHHAETQFEEMLEDSRQWFQNLQLEQKQ
ncbi:unnamed protein product [Ostreobium quekettii]|uniref:Uncharacterized protein n=1 Tax=Ostreobium quekettii TaxID=121088 RepID=A0A8S1IQB8_9CHLO|nr:unnamed protein product [Ostreobium quekettii]|eukprot:evm.model.scf_65.9 EVM.evm.TU.scf_65.9   scf_65:76527-78888(-)